MKGLKLSAIVALVATGALIGCSADHAPQSGVGGGAKDGSMSFNLLAGGNVTISSISYDVNTQAGADVVDGSIPVPDDQSQHVPVLGIQSLSSGDYTLQLSATGTLPGGATVPCTAPLTGFHVTSGTNTFVGDINMTCTVTSQSDTSGSATADVTVTTVQNTTGSVIETFAYGPRSVQGRTVGGTCAWSPIAVHIASFNAAIGYTWSATPDGTFTGTPTNGTYNCASPGDKTLTLTGTLNGQTSTKSVTVTCAPCGTCGNGIIEPGETCDESTPRCTACQITPVCGDNAIDAPETCDPPNGTTCDASCHIITGGTGGAGGMGTGGGAGAGAGGAGGTAAGAGGTAAGAGGTAAGAGGTAAGSGGTGGSDIATACMNCLASDPVEGALQNGYCAPDALCTNVQKCVMNAQCFNPIPAVCYCGITDAVACSADAFVPTGPCVTSMLAGAGPLTLGAPGTNSAMNARGFDPSFSTGIGMLIINDAATPTGNAGACFPTCFP